MKEIEGALQVISECLDIQLVSQKQNMRALKKILADSNFSKKYKVDVRLNEGNDF